MRFKYQNCNSFPVFVPGERGEQILFRPGQFTTKSWFSRFCGERKLTRLSIEGTAVKLPENTVPTSDIKGQPSESVPSVPGKGSFKNEETPTYTYNNGVYHCKLCDIFRTGSRESLNTHMSLSHKMTVPAASPLKLGNNDGEGERVVVGSMKSTSAHVPKSEEETSTVISTSSSAPTANQKPAQPLPSSVPVASENKEEVHACDVPGCGKKFTSKRGLDMHIRRVHGASTK